MNLTINPTHMSVGINQVIPGFHPDVLLDHSGKMGTEERLGRTDVSVVPLTGQRHVSNALRGLLLSRAFMFLCTILVFIPSARPGHEEFPLNGICHELRVNPSEKNLAVEFWFESFENQKNVGLIEMHGGARKLSIYSRKSKSAIRFDYEYAGMPGIRADIHDFHDIPGWKHVLMTTDGESFRIFLNGEEVPGELIHDSQLAPELESKSASDDERIGCLSINANLLKVGTTANEYPKLSNIWIWQPPDLTKSYELPGQLFTPGYHGQRLAAIDNSLLFSFFQNTPADNFSDEIPESHKDLSGGIQRLDVKVLGQPEQVFEATLIMSGWPFYKFHIPTNQKTAITFLGLNGTIDMLAYSGRQGIYLEDLPLIHTETGVIEGTAHPGLTATIQIKSPFASEDTRWVGVVQKNDSDKVSARILSERDRTFLLPWIPDEHFSLHIHDAEEIITVNLEDYLHNLNEETQIFTIHRDLESVKLTEPFLFNPLSTGNILEKLSRAKHVVMDNLGDYILIGSEITGLISVSHNEVRPVGLAGSAISKRVTCIHSAGKRAIIGTTAGLFDLILDQFGEIQFETLKSSEIFSGIYIHSITIDSDRTTWVGTDKALYYKYDGEDKWYEFLLNAHPEGVKCLRNPSKGILSGIGLESGPFLIDYDLERLHYGTSRVTIIADQLNNPPQQIRQAFNSEEVVDFVYSHSTKMSHVTMLNMLLEIDSDWNTEPVLFSSILAIKPRPNGDKIIFSSDSQCLSYKHGAYHEILDATRMDESPKILQFTFPDDFQMAILTEKGIFKLREGPVSTLYTQQNKHFQFIQSADKYGIYFISQHEPYIGRFSDNRYSDLTDIPESVEELLGEGIRDASWSARHSSLLIAGDRHLIQHIPESGEWHVRSFEEIIPDLQTALKDANGTETDNTAVMEDVTFTEDGIVIGRLRGENVWSRLELAEGSSLTANLSRMDLPEPHARLHCVYESPTNEFRAFGTNRGLFIERNGKWIRGTLEDKVAFRYSVNHLSVDGDEPTSRLVVVTGFGLYYWDPSHNSATLQKLDMIAPDSQVFYKTNSGKVVVWDSKCLATIARPEMGLKIFCDVSHPMYLGEDQTYIDSTMADDGSVWLLTQSNIYKIEIPDTKPETPQVIHATASGNATRSTTPVPEYGWGKIRITGDPDEYLIIERPGVSQNKWATGIDTFRFRNSKSKDWHKDIFKLDSQDCFDLIRAGDRDDARIIVQRMDAYLNISDDMVFAMEIWTPLWSRSWMKILVGVLLLTSFMIALLFWLQARQKRVDLQNQKLKSMTELRQSNVRLREALTKIKAAQESKDQFLATMSHEIRTPMNGIIGMTELLMDSGLNIEQKDFGRSIHSCAQSLLTIINDILDLSKIEAGKIIIEATEFDVFDIIDETASLYRSVVRSKSIKLDVIVDETIPQYLLGDPTRIKQILNNFLNNAIKFTENGDVQLQARVLHRDQKFCKLILSVKDTGIGIPEQKLETIFDSFSQVDASTTRKYGGTGLGLTICKKLTELMGGRILVESETGKGSTFSIIIPFEISPRKADTNRRMERHIEAAQEDTDSADGSDESTGSEQQEPAEEMTSDSTSSANPNEDCFSRSLEMAVEEVSELEKTPEKKYLQDESIDSIFDLPIASFDDQILVVEDNRINQRLLLKFLSKLNLKASVVQNGEEAVEAYYKTRYPIILMDCQMPIMDGYTATGKILEIAEKLGQKPTIIALTANAMPSDRQKCLQAGMHDYLAKPITLTGLRETLERNGVKIFHETGDK